MVNIMGMMFSEDAVPDFGSIEIRQSTVTRQDKEYILNSADVEKLDLITNAGAGSTAMCTDNGVLYIKHLDTWEIFGGTDE